MFVVNERRPIQVFTGAHPTPETRTVYTVDDTDDGLSICSFVDAGHGWCRPAAERVADLLNRFGLVEPDDFFEEEM